MIIFDLFVACQNYEWVDLKKWIICIAYFLNTGPFSLLVKHYPPAILGLLINFLLCVAFMNQFCTNLSRNRRIFESDLLKLL